MAFDDVKLTPPIRSLLVQAQRLQEAGRLKEAESLYRQIPRSSWNNEVINAFAILLIHQGNYSQAETLLRKILKQSPKFTAARMNLGNLALEQGDTATAIRELTRLLHEGIDSANLYYNLGRALLAAGNFTQAFDMLNKCLAKERRYPLLPIEMGNVLRKLKRYEEARHWYQQACVNFPHNPGPWVNIGNCYLDEDKFHAAEAAVHNALKLNLNYAPAWSNLCAIHVRQGLIDMAEQEGRRAINLDPHFAGAYRNLAQALIQKCDLAGAYQCLAAECALPQAPPETKLRLICLLGEHKRYAEALELEQSLGAAIAKIPDFSLYTFPYHREICYWHDHARLEQQVVAHVKTARIERGMQLSPWMAMLVADKSLGVTAAELRNFTEALATYLFKGFINTTPTPLRQKQPNGKIRLGYLSADFHAHATAYLMIEVFEQHDHEQFETFAYAIDPDSTCSMRQRLKQAFGNWREVSALSARETAAVIQADAIDILIDLKGYTHNARPEVFALRPAPIQVGYLGYPGTLGITALDYLIADTFIIPPQQQPHYTETIAYLPNCYQANDSHRSIAAPVTREAEGLPEQGLVLCCFNHPRKISPKIFDTWCRLLHKLKNSVLWLFASHPLVKKHLLIEAGTRGIAKTRLIFATHRPQAEHLSRLRLADLFIDTYPVNAHTTASDALYAGVPLITCTGDIFASRVAGSLLRSVGLADLITENLQAYEELVVQLGQNPVAINALKMRLAENLTTTTLFNSQKFTRNLEELYLKMWQDFENGAQERT